MNVSVVDTCAPQLRGTHWSVDELRELLALYHGEKGRFAYDAFAWLNEHVWNGQLPVPLVQWCLTSYGACQGLTRTPRDPQKPPVINLHPAIWSRRAQTMMELLVKKHLPPRGWAATIPAGPRYALDVILHELIHVDVNYLRGGWVGKTCHDNPTWCAAIEDVAARLKGTMLELPPFKAAPTKRYRENGCQPRRTPEGCLSMDQIGRFPDAVREPRYYEEQDVPFVGW